MQYKLTYILIHAPAPEPASYFPQKKAGEEAEQNGPHPAFREGSKGRSSHCRAATDEHLHVAHLAVWKQTARAGPEKGGGENLLFHSGDRKTEKNGRMIDDSQKR